MIQYISPKGAVQHIESNEKIFLMNYIMKSHSCFHLQLGAARKQVDTEMIFHYKHFILWLKKQVK